MAMIGSPAARDWTDSTGISVRLFFATARSPATTSTAKPAMKRWAGRSALCLGFEFAHRDVMCCDPLGLRELTAKWQKKINNQRQQWGARHSDTHPKCHAPHSEERLIRSPRRLWRAATAAP